MNENNIVTTSMYLWIDIDCYECQVWSKLHPEYQNGPLIVTSGNENTDVIISCDYEGKSYGIKKSDSVESARAKCPSLKVFKKTNTPDEIEDLNRFRGKIELTIKNFIRDNLNDVAQFYWEGNEEGYLNIPNEVNVPIYNEVKNFEQNPWKSNAKWIFGNDKDEAESHSDDVKRLEVGLNILAEVLRRIDIDTGLYGSGSVGTTKTIARISCQLNKPRGITVVTSNGLEQLFTLVKILDTPGLKGKNGKKILDTWKKPDGSSLETIQDFKEHVPLFELRSAGYLTGNKLLYALMSHWEDMDGSRKKMGNKKKIKKIKCKRLIVGKVGK